jgi:hypothetical protein
VIFLRENLKDWKKSLYLCSVKVRGTFDRANCAKARVGFESRIVHRVRVPLRATLTRPKGVTEQPVTFFAFGAGHHRRYSKRI